MLSNQEVSSQLKFVGSVSVDGMALTWKLKL